ncbi:Gfo/Idh/MocA family oxidoreductase [Pseudanabaenaceae cyanobacterium LEGE 13415]|nr:Gfo/Idh/MocA family oxidoreductase [Pseudanabaenaceae cyanobacterium LEGE 13415]
MAGSKLGVAIVGTGFGQKVHIPGFQAHPRTEVVAVYHRDLQKAQSIAQTHQIPLACSSIDEILNLPNVDGVSISTPPFLHYEMAKSVLDAGKHLLLEKPTALNVDQAKDLYSRSLKHRSITSMNFEFRFVPAWQQFADLLAQNYVGQKRLIKIDWLVSSRADASRPWNWYARKEQGGGALGALGSHTFDYVTWLFGEVDRLTAHLSTAIPQRPDPATGELRLVDSDDTCNLTLELVDGTPCQICISSVTTQGRGHWIEVYGDRGTLILGSDNQKDYVHGFKLWGAEIGQDLTELEIPKRYAFEQVFADGRIAPFIRIIDQWLISIDRQESVAPSLKEGVTSQLLMDLAQESNETGTWVKVPRW